MSTLFSDAGFGFGWHWALIMAPAVLYVGMYVVLRCWGKLRVNADGWHASGIDAGSRVLLSALLLLGWFQPVMKVESSVSRRVLGLFGAEPGEPAVSEVVVELVPMS